MTHRTLNNHLARIVQRTIFRGFKYSLGYNQLKIKGLTNGV